MIDQDKHEMFPRVVSHLASHYSTIPFMVVGAPSFLVRGVPYVVRSYNLKTRFEEGEEAIFKEVADIVQTNLSDRKILALHDLAGPILLSGCELRG